MMIKMGSLMMLRLKTIQMWMIDNINNIGKNIDDDDEEKTESDIPLWGGPKSSIQVRALS